ncbi:MAG: hypothetical protein Fur002_20110 [Anaerolineales bacterium]
MKTPSSIAGWCTVLFFLVYGIAAFITIPASGVILAFWRSAREFSPFSANNAF